MPYEASVSEDTPVDTTIFKNIHVEDYDSIGETLEVKCINQPQVTIHHLIYLKSKIFKNFF